MYFVVSRGTRGWYRRYRRRNHRRCSRNHGLRGHHRRRSRHVHWTRFRGRRRRHRNLKWRRLNPFLGRRRNRHRWRPDRRQRLGRNTSHRFASRRRVQYPGQVAGRNIHTGRPILRRKRNTPEIPGNFKLQSNLEEFAHRARALHPYHPPLRMERSAFRTRNIQRNHRILWNVMFRLVLTPVAIHHHRRGALFEWLPERVGSRHSYRYGLHNARAAALLCAGIGGL